MHPNTKTLISVYRLSHVTVGISQCEAYIWSWLVNSLLKETVSLLHLTSGICNRFTNHHWWQQGDLRSSFDLALDYWVCMCQTELKARLQRASGSPELAKTITCPCWPCTVVLETLSYEITQDISFSLAFLDPLDPGCSYSGGLLARVLRHKLHTQVSYLILMKRCYLKRRQMIQFQRLSRALLKVYTLCLFNMIN